MQAVRANNTGNFRNDVCQIVFDIGLSQSRLQMDIRINSASTKAVLKLPLWSHAQFGPESRVFKYRTKGCRDPDWCHL
jgi:hypothetical protein